MAKSGAELLLDLLAELGIRRIFGNPGTTELPLTDALAADTRFEYFLALHETPVMAMADGFAMASRSLGFVNLHACPGLGNSLGMLYNAWCEGTPLLVTAGQQDRRLRFEEPVLAGEMVDVARPWTKLAVEVTRIEDLPRAVRRAAQAALAPPTGPVFLALPIDVQLAEVEESNLDRTIGKVVDSRLRPPPESVAAAAKILAAARNPAILAGSRVAEQQAAEELTLLAERLGANVFSEAATSHGRLPIASDHPLYAGPLPLFSPQSRPRLEEFDALLAVGMPLLRQYIYYEPWRPIPPHAKIVHCDVDACLIGRNYPVEAGVAGSLKHSLADLEREISRLMDEASAGRARQRRDGLAARRGEEIAELRSSITADRDVRPATPLALMGALSDVLPDDVAVIEEAVTTTNFLFERLGAIKTAEGYFGHRGWALGWGMGCALGVKLAWPRRPVLAMIGEGAAMYGIQALWSAARYNIPVTFVICNNAQYRILKDCAGALSLPRAAAGRFVGCDLDRPEIDFVSLARSLGVAAERITDPGELAPRVAASLAGDRPFLFDVPIARDASLAP